MTGKGYLWACTALALICTSHGVVQMIDTPEAFAEFERSVNTGTDYYGDTVIVDADIDFSSYAGRIRPIGDSRESYFRGTFRAQGHVISNLIINTTARYAGLFGYTRGATIKNAILDETVHIISSYASSGNTFVGSFLGKCFTSDGPCVLQNLMSRASVQFSGRTESDAIVGGITGGCEYSGYYCNIRSCANYGEVVFSGMASWFSEIGGVIGLCEGTEAKRCKVHNSLNYGSVTNNGTAKDVVIGGIVGNMYGTTSVQNCVSVGHIDNKKPARFNHVGALAGYAFTDVSVVIRDYWTPNVGVDRPVGFNRSEVRVQDAVLTELDSSMISSLNTNAGQNSWDNWVLNINWSTFTFAVNNRVVFVTNQRLIILANHLMDVGFTYLGNFYGANLSRPVTDYVVTEDTNLTSWWLVNQYVLTYVFNETYNESTVVSFMKDLTLPELPPREGYTLYWCTKDNATCNPETMLPYNLTLYPNWVMPQSSFIMSYIDSTSAGGVSRYVKVTFDITNIWTSEVEAVVKEHAGDVEHEIIAIDDAGMTTDVTIKFANLEDSVRFVTNVKMSKKHAMEHDRITRVVYLDESLFDAANSLFPLSFFIFLFFYHLLK